MKKTINIISYVLSLIFILTSVAGLIYYLFFINKKEDKNLPTIAYMLEKYDIPVVEINGDTTNISKENKVEVSVNYHSEDLNFNSNATLKWQGSSSLAYEKKNYNINFIDEEGENNKIKIKDEWGEQSKYCLKANYIDYSSARNVVSAKLFGEIVHSRNKEDELDNLINGGAIDGFPVLIFMNDKYQGLYTFNIPKDKWLFNMDKNGNKAILMADAWTSSTSLNENISSNFAASGWELEHCSTKNAEWVNESFNKLIEFVKENDAENFKNNISSFVDLDRTIDLMLYTLIINAQDNTSKNILWVTYDGTRWVPSAYDLDGTWGLKYNGDINSSSSWLTLEKLKNGSNLLWQKIMINFEQEVRDRYFELRGNVLSFQNISSAFSNFVSTIPTELYELETILYPNIPSKNTSNLSQILYFAQENLKLLDAEFENLI